MWLDNLKELKKETGLSCKRIAELTNLPERTVIRIFSGDTDNPYMNTIHRIVSVLGGSLDDIFADTKAVIGNENLIVLQENLDVARAENKALKDEVVALTTENDKLKLTLEHKDEIIKLLNYFEKLSSTND